LWSSDELDHRCLVDERGGVFNARSVLLRRCKQRQNWMHLLFSCSAIAAAAICAFELGILNARTVE
jgi:uncharacterized protein (DUF1810 family)